MNPNELVMKHPSIVNSTFIIQVLHRRVLCRVLSEVTEDSTWLAPTGCWHAGETVQGPVDLSSRIEPWHWETTSSDMITSYSQICI